jgi:subtilisin family serine protease
LIKIAVLDTGVDATHPDLSAAIGMGTSILDGSNGWTDPNGHGTWLAGIAAATADNSNGIAGVAYGGVQIMPVQVLGADGIGQDSDIIAGVIWATDNGASVILMGFSSPGFSPSLQDAVDYAWSKGVVLVAAAGNESSSAATFPAGDKGVIGVSATDATDQLASLSNYGSTIFLAAPVSTFTERIQVTVT